MTFTKLGNQLTPGIPLWRYLGSRGEDTAPCGTSAGVQGLARQTNGNERRSSKERTQISLRRPWPTASRQWKCTFNVASGKWASHVKCVPLPPHPPQLMRNGNRLERSRALQGLRPSKHTNNVVKGKHNNELIVLPECHNECESHYAQCF